MARTVGIGKQDFEKIRKADCFYIDKTSFIKEWWDNNDDVTLITRPRRFGKTLNMSMLEQFFSLKYANREELFEGLAIWKEERYRAMQGTYPVISLSFANVKEITFEKTEQCIRQIIADLYNQHCYLMDSNLLSDGEKAYMHNIIMEKADAPIALSLHRLTDYLRRYYGKKVIILLDEYDTPMHEAYVNNFWDELVTFTRSFFNATFKTNPHLERAILTGITRVSRESVFSDLNNLEIVTTTSNKYETSFGFTEAEVIEALEEYGLAEKMPDVKSWYDGFMFGKVKDIYNPWSIINYLDKKKLGTYWANTSTNKLIGNLIQAGSSEIKVDFEDLLQGKILKKRIDEQIVFKNLSSDENAVWSLLLASGYLKTTAYTFDEETGEEWYQLALTNKEVQLMFKTMIRGWFTEEQAVYNSFVKALLKDDLKAMNVYMNRVALSTFSYFDTGKRASEHTEPERFYHGFVLGLLVELNEKYIILSNRESGFGRYDVILEPKNSLDNAMILEFKVYDPEEEKSLDDTVKNALKQIEEMNYEAELITRGVSRKNIKKYGFAFEGKKVLIGN